MPIIVEPMPETKWAQVWRKRHGVRQVRRHSPPRAWPRTWRLESKSFLKIYRRRNPCHDTRHKPRSFDESKVDEGQVTPQKALCMFQLISALPCVLRKCFRCSIFGPLVLCRSATSKFCISFQKIQQIESENTSIYITHSLHFAVGTMSTWHKISPT